MTSLLLLLFEMVFQDRFRTGTDREVRFLAHRVLSPFFLEIPGVSSILFSHGALHGFLEIDGTVNSFFLAEGFPP